MHWWTPLQLGRSWRNMIRYFLNMLGSIHYTLLKPIAVCSCLKFQTLVDLVNWTIKSDSLWKGFDTLLNKIVQLSFHLYVILFRILQFCRICTQLWMFTYLICYLTFVFFYLVLDWVAEYRFITPSKGKPSSHKLRVSTSRSFSHHGYQSL